LLTLLFKGDVGISIFKKQLLGKVPFSTSLIAAFTNGKQTDTASLKSFSWLSSFFLQPDTISIHNAQYKSTKCTESWNYQFNDIDNADTPHNNASLAPATTPEYNLGIFIARDKHGLIHKDFKVPRSCTDLDLHVHL